MSSEALTEIVVVLESVEPLAGFVMTTEGGFVSFKMFLTETLTELDDPTLPAASYAFA